MSLELGDSLKRLAPRPRSSLDIEDVVQRGRSHRRRRRVARLTVAALVAIAVPAGWAALDLTRDDAAPPVDKPDQNHVPPPEYPSPDEDMWRDLEGGWTRLEPPPSTRSGATSLWLGDSLFYWGGETDSGAYTFDDGYIYRPKHREWEPLPDAPLAARDLPASTWTGREVLIWGGRGPFRGAEDPRDGAAYSPALERWRRVPPAPIEGRAPAASVWTGSEFIVFGDSNRRAGRKDGAAYDPASDSWRRLPDAPLALDTADSVWTGDEMVILGADIDDGFASLMGPSEGIAYSPATDRWRTLPSTGLDALGVRTAWLDGEVLAVDNAGHVGAYDPKADRWRRLPDLPFQPEACSADLVVVRGIPVLRSCSRAAVWDRQDERWEEVAGLPRNVFGRPVAAGTVMAVVGAAYEGTHNKFWVYKP